MYWITGILGFVLLIAPFAAGYSTHLAATWTSLIAGAIVIAASFLEGFAQGKDRREYWASLLVGVAIILSPFILQFTQASAAMWTVMGIGALLALLAGSKLVYD